MSRAAALRADVERLRLEVSSAQAALRQAVTTLERVESELTELASEVAELEFETVAPTSAPSVHIEQQFVYTTAPAPEGAPSAASEAAPPPAPPPAPAPAGLPAPGPKSRFWYAVARASASGQHRGWGIYRDYQGFSDAVRNPGSAWSGRGKIPWADGACGQKFGSEQEAIAFLVDELKLAPDAVIPRHPFQ